MCYVCREGLAGVGYQHFCQHFRAVPGSKCTECDKCDLYRVEDEETVVSRAKERAEKEWWERQGNGSQEGLKERAGRQRVGSQSGKWRWIRWSDVAGSMEEFVESVVV